MIIKVGQKLWLFKSSTKQKQIYTKTLDDVTITSQKRAQSRNTEAVPID
jgi:hypothetical protein